MISLGASDAPAGAKCGVGGMFRIVAVAAVAVGGLPQESMGDIINATTKLRTLDEIIVYLPIVSDERKARQSEVGLLSPVALEVPV